MEQKDPDTKGLQPFTLPPAGAVTAAGIPLSEWMTKKDSKALELPENGGWG